MSEESTTPDVLELVRTTRDIVNRGDLDALMRFYAPDAVCDTTRTTGVILQGREAIRSHVQDWLGAYEEWEWHLEETLDLGNGVVFAVVRQHARPTGTTGHVQQREAFVYVWEEGLTVRLTTYPYSDIDEARAAAERLAEERG